MTGKKNKLSDIDVNNKQIILFLKKNKNFLIKYPKLLEIMEFPSYWQGTENIVDFNKYQVKKIKKNNIHLKSKIFKILNIIKINADAQNRILKACLRILNSKSLDNLLEIILKDFSKILNCDEVNIIFNNYTGREKGVIINKKIKIENIFKKNNSIILSNKMKYMKFFFPNSYKLINSFTLLKIKNNSLSSFLICLGSNDKNKFSETHNTDLISFLIKVCESKINSFNLN